MQPRVAADQKEIEVTAAIPSAWSDPLRLPFSGHPEGRPTFPAIRSAQP